MTNIEQQRAEATSHGAQRIVLSRVFDAPPSEVFRMWKDPQLWAQWFAPDPMTVPKAESDMRPGGRYSFVMRDPEGNDYESTGTFEEVDEPRRVVYRDSVEAMPDSFVNAVNEARGAPAGTPVADGIATVTFDDTGGRTKMTFSEEFDSPSTRDAWVQMQMVEGLDAGFDKLEKLLAREAVRA